MLEKIANKLLPIATKLSQQRHLSAVKDSFIISMPLVMGASLFVLLNALGTNFFNTDMFSGIATVAVSYTHLNTNLITLYIALCRIFKKLSSSSWYPL